MSGQTEQTTEVKNEQSTNSSETTTTETHTEQKQTSENTSTAPQGTSPESKTGDQPPKKEEAAPVEEDYDIELSKDSPLGQKELEEIATLAGDLGLTKEQAQKLVVQREDSYREAKKAGEGVWESKFNKSLEEMNKDPEFTGEARKATDIHINRALQAFGSQELVEYLNTAQGGSNLHLARFIANIGKALAPADNDSSLTNKDGKPPVQETTIEQRMYPSMFKK